MRLVQVDAVIDAQRLDKPLRSSDLELTVAGREIQEFFLDSACATPTEAARAAEGTEGPPSAPTQRTSIVFFFDQTHLTLTGRQLSIDLAKTIVPRLIAHGARGSLVSSGPKTRTIVPMTTDVGALLAGLEAMRKDGTAFDTYASLEGKRVKQVNDVLRQEGREIAWAYAGMYARDEFFRARYTEERVVIALDGFAEAAPPKALVFFSDILRQKAGLYYYMAAGSPDALGQAMAPSAAAEVDAIVSAAIARGVHLFTVQGRGLNSDSASADTLVALAAQTGGDAFLHASPDKIVDTIQAKVACPSVISFPPGDFPRDKQLGVVLRARDPRVGISSIVDRIVIPSESALLTARLSAAFQDPTTNRTGALHVVLVPRGGDGESWRALAQVRLDTSVEQKIGVDLGATIIQRDQVVDSFSRSIATSGSPRPLIVERKVTIGREPLRIVAVAHDHRADTIGSVESSIAWPVPSRAGAEIAPVAVLQSRDAAVAHEPGGLTADAIALDEGELLDRAQITTLESVVCRGAGVTGPLVVDRFVEGLPVDTFVPMTIAPDDGPCVQTIDSLRPGVLRDASADYRIVVRDGSQVIADQRRTLRQATDGP